MRRRCYTATVDRIVSGTGAQAANRDYLWLCAITDEDGTPFGGAPWLNHPASLRRLGLRPGDRIRFNARMDAFTPGRKSLGKGISDPVAFLAELAKWKIDPGGVIFRLTQPTNITPMPPEAPERAEGYQEPSKAPFVRPEPS